MKIDVTTPFLDFDRKPIREVVFDREEIDERGQAKIVRDEDGKPKFTTITFKTVARMVLSHVHPEEKGITWESVHKRGELAWRINDAILPVELKAEEATLLKQCAAKCAAAGVLTTAYAKQLEDMIENAKELAKPKVVKEAAE